MAGPGVGPEEEIERGAAPPQPHLLVLLGRSDVVGRALDAFGKGGQHAIGLRRADAHVHVDVRRGPWFERVVGEGERTPNAWRIPAASSERCTARILLGRPGSATST